ncbi:hypothetical protein BLNAU_8639 [Blattamonas nauphoetae]|uniref:Transmembrane protein n=1 Tax=Blattamonas nauphoetae TaxID=2049346 RepID=A0ABQ9XY48_9EUKA|nr:hypothetical protein BLNAU_8639 [Blattamonas nauphoetae]
MSTTISFTHPITRSLLTTRESSIYSTYFKLDSSRIGLGPQEALIDLSGDSALNAASFAICAFSGTELTSGHLISIRNFDKVNITSFSVEDSSLTGKKSSIIDISSSAELIMEVFHATAIKGVEGTNLLRVSEISRSITFRHFRLSKCVFTQLNSVCLSLDIPDVAFTFESLTIQSFPVYSSKMIHFITTDIDSTNQSFFSALQDNIEGISKGQVTWQDPEKGVSRSLFSEFDQASTFFVFNTGRDQYGCGSQIRPCQSLDYLVLNSNMSHLVTTYLSGKVDIITPIAADPVDLSITSKSVGILTFRDSPEMVSFISARSLTLSSLNINPEASYSNDCPFLMAINHITVISCSILPLTNEPIKRPLVNMTTGNVAIASTLIGAGLLDMVPFLESSGNDVGFRSSNIHLKHSSFRPQRCLGSPAFEIHANNPIAFVILSKATNLTISPNSVLGHVISTNEIHHSLSILLDVRNTILVLVIGLSAVFLFVAITALILPCAYCTSSSISKDSRKPNPCCCNLFRPDAGIGLKEDFDIVHVSFPTHTVMWDPPVNFHSKVEQQWNPLSLSDHQDTASESDSEAVLDDSDTELFL